MGKFKYANYAKGRTPRGVMNGLETRFAKYLEELKQEGTILWWKYEPLRFNLCKNTSYTPDFMVMNKDFEIEIYETKGHWLEPSRLRVKMSNDIFPFRFFGAMWNRKEKKWDLEEF